MATAYNDGLQDMVNQFNKIHSNATVVLYDSWVLMTRVLGNPEEYGYQDATCMNEDGSSCIWWNDLHPGWKYHQCQPWSS
ncbi:hypothetical protein BGW36DRAFT_424337 [Talaromyces proteolyticus]|uniref:Uncharacterized protein n=1 Tax=Talaromyces proteolyticus TaxID=1131652 RepID=A0AAD4L1B5_9EURO|nr:uncharacterized protein BGW36DRAFT_424337 [Talaromyces proteolyticus]KAH8702045.1 hypothetical protein BGW36DRAFT_424337 [Talaromyces proteolyticus]